MLGLFNDISRVNHSCRPNAFWAWNEERSEGTLFAIDNIPNNAEILIEYTADTKPSFKNGQGRRDLLNRSYNFRCDCGACNAAGQINRRNQADDQARLQAQQLLSEIQDEQPRQGESVARAVLRRLQSTNTYITLLGTLQIRDTKLAHAHSRLADLHEKEAVHATLPAHRNNCQVCQQAAGGNGRLAHLKQSLSALGSENTSHVRCLGIQHKDLAEVERKTREIQLKIARNGG